MRVSTRGRYALYILLDIAMNNDGTPVPIKDTSARLEISQKYLEQIVSALVHAGYLRSVRGAHGGYQLVGSPEDIDIGDVLTTMEGQINLSQCDGCFRSEGCLIAPMWREFEEFAHRMVHGISLQNLIDGDLDALQTLPSS